MAISYFAYTFSNFITLKRSVESIYRQICERFLLSAVLPCSAKQQTVRQQFITTQPTESSVSTKTMPIISTAKICRATWWVSLQFLGSVAGKIRLRRVGKSKRYIFDKLRGYRCFRKGIHAVPLQRLLLR